MNGNSSSKKLKSTQALNKESRDGRKMQSIRKALKQCCTARRPAEEVLLEGLQ